MTAIRGEHFPRTKYMPAPHPPASGRRAFAELRAIFARRQFLVEVPEPLGFDPAPKLEGAILMPEVGKKQG